MLNKLKSSVFIGSLCILFGLLCSQASAQDRNSGTCKDGSCSAHERKELTPAEKECMDDINAFLFNYKIISFMHRKYVEEVGSVPSGIQRDLAEADAAYSEFKNQITSSQFWAARMVHYIPNTFTMVHCREMYNKEMNDLFGSHFSPTSDDPFLKSNWFCNTSYKDALQNIRRLLSKYRNGRRCE